MPGIRDNSIPAVAQAQLEVQGCTNSWQLHLYAASASLLCAAIIQFEHTEMTGELLASLIECRRLIRLITTLELAQIICMHMH